MLHGRLLHRTLIGLAATAALALASPWAATARADAAQVTVVSPGGAQQTLALDALAGSEDIVERPYALRSASGESTESVSGFSLAAILNAAGADPYGFSYLEVQRPAGGAVVLSRGQALDSGPDGPPAVYASPTGTDFLRPSTGPEDLNAGDCFVAPQGISIVLRKGTHLKVRASASPRRVRPGQTVHFKAIVEQASSGEQLQYSWYFDDGSSASGPEVTHSFAKHGSYDVVLGVTANGDDTGTSAVVTIQIGAPLDGPNRKGGGQSNAAGAPDHGAASIPSSSTSGVAPAPSLESRRGRAPADTQRGRRPRVRRGTTTPAPAKAAEEPASGNLVEGELVSATTNPAEPPPNQAAARSGHLADDGGNGIGIPTAAWGLLATVGLLGAGALVEARNLLP